jgi:ATP-dependent Clp protease ATP-binding subunit ClpA
VFSRFSSSAKRALRAAEQASRNHNHYYVGVEHLLFALLEEHDPGVERRLDEMHADRNFLYREVRSALGTGEDRLWDGILITPRSRRVFRLAEDRTAEGAEVEPVALLDAILAEGGGAAAELLRKSCRNSPGQAQVAG